MVVMTLYGILSITLFVLWIKHKSVLRQRQKLASKFGSMKGNLVQTSEKLDLLSRGVDTILSDAPKGPRATGSTQVTRGSRVFTVQSRYTSQ
ncbi:MAG: hypothetical protein Ct9H90mP1_2360 [Methanobacteriota archaeon]|nr:MAG: hypothetical protein Ct9H90mP1_2360 [Euryarchaeota archaeon]